MKHTALSGSAAQTRSLGERLAVQLREGDVLLLSGDLGAGKSELCRGIARGLGISGHVPSPTFSILNLYEEGRLPFKHFDWYRIREPDELLESGLDEQVGHDGVTAIEWHERAPHLLPEDHLLIDIRALAEDQRLISWLPRGSFRELDWEALLEHDEHPGD